MWAIANLQFLVIYTIIYTLENIYDKSTVIEKYKLIIFYNNLPMGDNSNIIGLSARLSPLY